LPPEPTRPAAFQFLRRSQRSNTSSLREQNQSKQRANNRCLFNGLQMRNSVSLLDSYSYKLGGGYFFLLRLPLCASLRTLCLCVTLFLFSPFDFQPFSQNHSVGSTVRFFIASRCTNHPTTATLLLTRRVSPRAIPPPQPAGRTHSAVPKFSVFLTNHKTKASKSCSRN
jgi:hypothetical protein